MSIHVSRALVMLVASVAILSTPAYAVDHGTGAYIGAKVGQGEYQGACDDVASVAGGFGLPSSCEDKDTAFKIYGGYRFLPYLAAEIGYTNPGKVTATIGAASAELKSWEIPIYAVGILPLADDELWLMAKVGGVYWDLTHPLAPPASRSLMELAFNTTSRRSSECARNMKCSRTWAMRIRLAGATSGCGRSE